MSNPTHIVVGPREPDNKKFGAILEELRVKARFSRIEAAEVIGVTSEFIRLIEKGERIPAMASVSPLLTAYKIEHDIGVRYVEFDRYSVEFTSRIQNSRYGKTSAIGKQVKKKRDEKMGQIIRLMVTASDSTLSDILVKLTGEENNGAE